MQIWNGPENNHSTRREEMAIVFLSLLFYLFLSMPLTVDQIKLKGIKLHAGSGWVYLSYPTLSQAPVGKVGTGVWARRQESPGP